MIKLDYELIDNNNIKEAILIQSKIFENECAYLHYKYGIDTNYQTHMYYIVKENNIPVGVSGLYIKDDIDKDSVWLGWFGILPEFRRKGLGRQSLLDMIEKAKMFNRKYFRLYTWDKEGSVSNVFYNSIMHMCERYNNKEDYNYDGNCYIYSYSLCDEPIEKWNDRFINIKQDIKEEEEGSKYWKTILNKQNEKL